MCDEQKSRNLPIDSAKMKLFQRNFVAIVFTIFFVGWSSAQSHNRELGTPRSTNEKIYSEVVHKENKGFLSYFQKVEVVFQFPTVSGVPAGIDLVSSGCEIRCRCIPTSGSCLM